MMILINSMEKILEKYSDNRTSRLMVESVLHNFLMQNQADPDIHIVRHKSIESTYSELHIGQDLLQGILQTD